MSEIIVVKLGIIIYLSSLFLYKVLEINWIKKWFIDTPNEDRKLHDKPIPRCGGLVFAGVNITSCN